MKLKAVVLGLGLTPAVALAWPWSIDMMNQPSIKPQEGVMAPFPKRSIPIQGSPTQVSNRQEADSLTNPVEATKASVGEGRTLFRIYCAACHGKTGEADSPVSSKIGAADLTSDRVQNNLSEGWIFGTITFGSFVMPAYGKPQGRDDKRGANDLTVEERWHVVNYVKHKLLEDSQQEGTRTASAE